MRRVNAEPNEFPWAAAILRDVGGGHLVPICGGALIDASWVLTAALCFVTKHDRVIVGAADLAARDAVELKVREVHPHPDFDPASLQYDVALLKLAEPRTGVPTLALTDSTHVLQGTGTVVGWGSDKLGGNFSMTLRKLEVPFSTPEGASSLLLGNPGSAHAISTGDSGSPLLLLDPETNKWTALGIVSDRGGKATPDRYTDVSRVLPFVRATLNPARVHHATERRVRPPQPEA